MNDHDARYRGVFAVTVTCRCGWVSQHHRSRGRARRAHDTHLRVVWLTRLVDRLETAVR